MKRGLLVFVVAWVSALLAALGMRRATRNAQLRAIWGS